LNSYFSSSGGSSGIISSKAEVYPKLNASLIKSDFLLVTCPRLIPFPFDG